MGSTFKEPFLNIKAFLFHMRFCFVKQQKHAIHGSNTSLCSKKKDEDDQSFDGKVYHDFDGIALKPLSGREVDGATSFMRLQSFKPHGF